MQKVPIHRSGILAILQEKERVADLQELGRRHGAAESMFCRWCRKYGCLGISEACQLTTLADRI